jgi:hypothetical protein
MKEQRMNPEILPALIDRPGKYAAEDPLLIPGDHVKLGVCCDPGSPCTNEWLWFEVTAVEGAWPNAVYHGELCNRPVFISPARLRPGVPVEFRPGHVYSVVHDSPARPAGAREQPPG